MAENSYVVNPPPRTQKHSTPTPTPHENQRPEHQPLYPPYSPVPRYEELSFSPSVKTLCEILKKTPPEDAQAALSSSQIQPIPEIVLGVLGRQYGSPSSAVAFFRWAGSTRKLDERCWNLMVDVLGKNRLFEQMWDAIRSMRQEGVLSVSAFVSVSGSYCVAGRFGEAIMSFDVMERYGVEPNIFAVNSLLSAICREDNHTAKALEFFERIKTKITPDADSFAILLEGWEKEGNVAKAKTTFGEMVIRVGWSPQYLSAYDAFLNTLLHGNEYDEAMKFLQVMKGKNCLPGLKFFSNALDILVKKNDSAHAILLWDIMVGSGLVPNLVMCNAMIGLLCDNSDVDNAFRLLDDMVFHGAFPDSLTYNTIFECLIKMKKVRDVGNFFIEMIKNEWPPTHSNCAEAIAVLFEGYDPEAATEIWEYMLENRIFPLEDSANAMLIGLCNLDRPTELRRFTEKMLDRRIKIYESTKGKIKNAFSNGGRNAQEAYDHLSRKWKSF